MTALYTDKGRNIACGSDHEGNVWEARHSGEEYHLFKNGRYQATMSTQSNIMVLFNQVLRQKKQEVKETICVECEGDGCTKCTAFCGDCLTPLENCGCKP